MSAKSNWQKLVDGDPEKGKQILRFAVMHNDSNFNFPPEIKTLADTIYQKAAQAAGTGPSPTFGAIKDTAMSVKNALDFQGAVIQQPYR